MNVEIYGPAMISNMVVSVVFYIVSFNLLLLETLTVCLLIFHYIV